MGKYKDKICANGVEIAVISSGGDDDFICLTLGLWETLNNPNFKVVEFDSFKHAAGSNAFTLSPQKWIASTNTIGLQSRSGNRGGTQKTPRWRRTFFVD